MQTFLVGGLGAEGTIRDPNFQKSISQKSKSFKIGPWAHGPLWALAHLGPKIPKILKIMFLFLLRVVLG